jgi:hypothetical protein
MNIIIDHVMFPIYNNNNFLLEVAKEYKKEKIKFNVGKQNKLYKGIYLFCGDFYIEHLSTTKHNYYWTNALCIQCDKKYWKYYKNPDSQSEDFMTPKFGCGFFLVSPTSDYVKWRQRNRISCGNMIIYVSKKLYDSVKNLCGLMWNIPKYVKVHKLLLQPYDIVVMDKLNRIAPLFQTNSQIIE